MEKQNLSRLASRTSTVLIVLYLLVNITGPLFLNEIVIPLRIPGEYDFKIRLLMCLPITINKIIPVCFSLLIYSIALKLGYKNTTWILLGLIEPLLSIILLFSIYLTDKLNESKLNDRNKLIRNITVLLILGLVFRYTNRYITLVPFLNRLLLENDTNQNIYWMTGNVLTIFYVLYVLLINIGVAIWINRESKIKELNPKTWTLLGLFGGLFAPILFNLFGLIRSHKVSNLL